MDTHAKLPWEAKRPWVGLGMSQKQWYGAGRPAEKPAAQPLGGTAIPRHLRRVSPQRQRVMNDNSPQGHKIQAIIKAVFGRDGTVKPSAVAAALKVEGITINHKQRLYDHLHAAIAAGVIPAEALVLQPRARLQEALLDEVVRLATPQQPGGVTTVPKLTEQLTAAGQLDNASPKTTREECVRRYVNAGVKAGRIKSDWIVSGHRSQTRERIKALVPAIVEQNAPINVRGVFYKLGAQGAVDKNRPDHEVARVSEILVELRESGVVDPDNIVDLKGTLLSQTAHTDPLEALLDTAERYRRDIWAHVPDRVVICIEKNGLTDVVWPVCRELQVPLLSPGGFGSYTLAKDLARLIDGHDGTTYVYYFGDHDPSGLCIDEAFERRVRSLATSNFAFKRVGLQPEHIRQHGLITRAVNRQDRRAKDFLARYGDAAADLDALDPNTLRNLVEGVIRRHICDRDIACAQYNEAWDRELMRQWIEQLKRSRH